MTARGTFYQKMWQMGALSANDIMDMEDRPHVPDGDTRWVPINFQTVTRAITPPEPAVTPAPAAPTVPPTYPAAK